MRRKAVCCARMYSCCLAFEPLWDDNQLWGGNGNPVTVLSLHPPDIIITMLMVTQMSKSDM